MRNFPHQVNRIEKLRGALQVCADIIAAGRDPGDDGEFGFQVARSGIYTFRGLATARPQDIEAVITRERLKPLANQGPRTFARDLRRTLTLLGFLQEDVDQGTWSITPSGQTLLALPDPPDAESARIWTRHLLDLALSDNLANGGISHPASNMLRLVARNPGIEKSRLAFALEMHDDSEGELLRAEQLIAVDFNTALRSINASAYQAANAVKILPSLLEQLRLMGTDGGCLLTAQGTQALGIALPNETRREFGLRNPRPGKVITHSTQVPSHTYSPGHPATTDEQLHAALVLQERTQAHQELVRRIIDKLAVPTIIRTSEDSFDILVIFTNRQLLVEAKTIREDGLIQARIALGQLFFYEYFDVSLIAPGLAIQKVAAFDAEPGRVARDFLRHYGIACLVSTAGHFEAEPEIRDSFLP